ncbi:MAG: hypothetical protein WC997_13905 [Porticoccaceae bacterium]
MSWLAENWIWVVLGGGFIGMHLFGHRMGGGCGGHGHRSHGKDERDEGKTDEPA